jgi:hypothetical protein
MDDNTARGLVLKRLYDLRDVKQSTVPQDFADLGFEQNKLGRLMEQLADERLINWKPLKGGMGVYLIFMAQITGQGTKVIEGIVRSASIKIDNSVNVHGSQGVQIGGQGNTQNVTMDVGKLINAIDGGSGTVQEKEEAKSLLKKVMENPLVKGAIELWAKAHFGG